MKILYLILGSATQGVKNKILDKTSFLRQAGADVSILLITGSQEALKSEESIEVLWVDYRSVRALGRLIFLWRFSIILEQKKTYKTLSGYLDGKNFDVILMRYPIADYFLFRFMTRFASRFKILFEHNTLEEEELRLRADKSTWYRYFYWSERFFGSRTRRMASGLICVTNEIERRQAQIAGSAIPTVTISNGIDVLRTTFNPPRQENFPQPLNVLFLAGSEAPWHGVDILLNSLGSYNGSANVHCYIAGSIDAKSQERVTSMPQVTLLGHQENDALDAVFQKCHIGVGSLALFRNNMSEACTLKVREYWARGLPIVLGYDDTDLMNNTEMKRFFLKVEISVDPFPTFDFNAVVSFANTVLKITNLNEMIRSHALDTVHYPVKAKAYLSFLKSVLS